MLCEIITHNIKFSKASYHKNCPKNSKQISEYCSLNCTSHPCKEWSVNHQLMTTFLEIVMDCFITWDRSSVTIKAGQFSLESARIFFLEFFYWLQTASVTLTNYGISEINNLMLLFQTETFNSDVCIII